MSEQTVLDTERSFCLKKRRRGSKRINRCRDSEFSAAQCSCSGNGIGKLYFYRYELYFYYFEILSVAIFSVEYFPSLGEWSNPMKQNRY